MKRIKPYLKIGIWVLILSLFGVTTVRACMWDHDTLAMEAKGLPDVVQIISGRFERNPPLYYKMRLIRVVGELQTQPKNLNFYDDAGVASDRLGRSDQALQWMAKKRTQLDKLPQNDPTSKDHWYRYYANIGTFRVHRWLKQGADKKRLKEVKQARNEIAKAIEINPDAHFGREKVQLAVMEWIINPKPKDATEAERLSDYLRHKKFKFPEAIKGLSGLIALGNAWESVDVFDALGEMLAWKREASIGYLARLRTAELIDNGKGSLLLQVKGEALKQKMELLDTRVTYKDIVQKEFPKLRQAADKWHTNRIDYMTARLKAGEHPDTHPNFWNAYREIPPLVLEDSFRTRMRLFMMEPSTLIGMGLFLVLAVPVTLGFMVRKIWRIYLKRRKVASEQGLL